MRKNLAAMAKKLSEKELHELIRLKREDDKKLIGLRKKRDKIAAQLDEVKREIAEYEGSLKVGRTKKVSRPKKAAGTGKRRRLNLSAAVRDVFAQADAPLKAAQVVEGLPGVGMKVKDEADMKKRVSVVLASQKKYFEQVQRGVYQLKDS